MRRAIFLAAARDDLLHILEYIAEESGSVETAVSFVQALRAQCNKLASFPTVMGRARPDIRSFPFKGYAIFFRYSEERFEVVNILEGHRDIDAFLEAD